jgi:hypothetical protein
MSVLLTLIALVTVVLASALILLLVLAVGWFGCLLVGWVFCLCVERRERKQQPRRRKPLAWSGPRLAKASCSTG